MHERREALMVARGVRRCITTPAPFPQFVYLGAPSGGAEETYQPETRLRLGLGARASTTSDEVLLR